MCWSVIATTELSKAMSGQTRKRLATSMGRTYSAIEVLSGK